MLSVIVHKDVGEYQPKIIGRLTFRSLVCVALSLTISCALGSYAWFVLHIPIDFIVHVIPILTLPIWATGFWRPKGMAAEKFLPLWFVHTFTRNVLLYRSPISPSIKQLNRPEGKRARRMRRIRAGEAYEPTQGFVSYKTHHEGGCSEEKRSAQGCTS